MQFTLLRVSKTLPYTKTPRKQDQHQVQTHGRKWGSTKMSGTLTHLLTSNQQHHTSSRFPWFLKFLPSTLPISRCRLTQTSS